ncbi:MAG: hypothetical protein GF329_22245 [Candidatus Lokiarchaeota archaeon]|nr:hypothetical protein [Candidatus Lokiarchaeota archaeon]
MDALQMNDKIFVLGSIAFDYLMDFNDQFTKHAITRDNMNMNMSLVVDSYRYRFGGTAGNICYNLGLLKKPSIMVSSVGNDFFKTRYPRILEENLVDIRVNIHEEDFTARCFVVSDINKNQIITFYAGALKNAYKINLFRKISQFDDIKIAINAPNPVNAMVSYQYQLLKLGIPTIFDPGQQIGQFTRDTLRKLIEKINFIIVNENEFKLLQRRSNYSKQDLCSKIPKIIVTLGGDGSILYDNGQKSEIPVAKPKKIIDPTGAGDGYRSGILSGIIDNVDLYECCQIGAVVGSFIVETSGGQEHIFTENIFKDRYEKNFGNFPKRYRIF